VSKRLSILRHAKSSWDDRRLSDHDRPLNKRGLRDAPALGLRLKDEGIIPNRILASSAERAQETARLVGKPLGFTADTIHTNEGMYLASAGTLTDIASECDDKIEHLMIVAHNPGMTDLVNRLSNVQLDNLPTCGIFCIDFDIDSWQQLPGSSGICNWYHYPKLQR